MSYRVWAEPDGSVKIEVLAVDDPAVRAYTAAAQKRDGRLHPDATFMDVTKEELVAMLPKDAKGEVDRSQRAQWRLEPGERVVSVGKDVIT